MSDEKPTKVTYVGGVDAVDVKLPSGRVLTVERDETVEVSAGDADALLESPDWAKPKTTAKAKAKEKP